MIQHDDQASARSEHTEDLADRLVRVRCVMQHTMRINEVEGTGGHVEVLRVAYRDVPLEIEQCEAPLREGNRAGRQVDARVASTGPGELHGIGAKAAPDLEYVQPPCGAEIDSVRDVRLERIAVPLDALEECRRAPFLVHELGSAGTAIPEVADLLLQIGRGCIASLAREHFPEPSGDNERGRQVARTTRFVVQAKSPAGV